MSLARFLLPPVNRLMPALDRSFFKKTIPLTAARVFDQSQLPTIRQRIEIDLLEEKRFQTRIQIGKATESEVLVLRPQVKFDDISTVSAETRNFIKNKVLELTPYDLQLEYGDWTYEEILGAILPENAKFPILSEIKRIGPLANIIVPDELKSFKTLIAEVLCDKDRTVQTVFAPADQEGPGFKNEVLAGPPAYHADLSHQGSTYSFHLDSARFEDAYFDTSLATERKRIVQGFAMGQAVADVFAGVGPLAVAAAKRGAVVFANEPNKNVYSLLVENRKNNKVKKNVFVKSNQPGRFLRSVVKKVFSKTVDFQVYKLSKHGQRIKSPLTKSDKILPGCISHFVFSDPKRAIPEIGGLRGIYSGRENIFARGGGYWKLHFPLIYAYAYHPAPESRKEEAAHDLFTSISNELEHPLAAEDMREVHFVRQEGPSKSLYCVTFQLPGPVAFAVTEEQLLERTKEVVKQKEDQEKIPRWEYTPSAGKNTDDRGDNESLSDSDDEPVLPGPRFNKEIPRQNDSKTAWRMPSDTTSRHWTPPGSSPPPPSMKPPPFIPPSLATTPPLSSSPPPPITSRPPPPSASKTQRDLEAQFARNYTAPEGLPNWKAKVHKKKEKREFLDRRQGNPRSPRTPSYPSNWDYDYDQTTAHPPPPPPPPPRAPTPTPSFHKQEEPERSSGYRGERNQGLHHEDDERAHRPRIRFHSAATKAPEDGPRIRRHEIGSRDDPERY